MEGLTSVQSFFGAGYFTGRRRVAVVSLFCLMTDDGLRECVTDGLDCLHLAAPEIPQYFARH